MATIELDAYELGNLRHFLEWAGNLANTGDWYGQVLHKLETASHYVGPLHSNIDDEGLDHRLVFEVIAGRKPGRMEDLPWHVKEDPR